MYRQIYQEYKKEPSDKAFFDEHKSEITLYQNVLSNLKKSYYTLPDTKKILKHLNLLQEYSCVKSDMNNLY